MRVWMPLTVWVLAIMAAWQLAIFRVQPIDAMGVASERRAVVVPLVDGTVNLVNYEPLDRVDEGTVVALMDNAVIKSQLEVARQEMKQLQSQYEAEQLALESERLGSQLQAGGQFNQDRRDHLEALRELQLDRDRAELEYRDRQLQRQADQATLSYLDALVEGYEQAGAAVPAIVKQQARAQRESLRVTVQEGEALVERARRMYEAAQSRLNENREELESLVSDRETLQALLDSYDPNVRLAPIREAILVAQARVDELSAQLENLVLRAPISGQVATVNMTTGQSLLRGSEVMEIAALEAPFIEAWIDQQNGRKPQVGDTVQIVTRTQPMRKFNGTITEVGSRIERFPQRLHQNPNLPVFGRPIRVAAEAATELTPGEVLNLRFTGE